MMTRKMSRIYIFLEYSIDISHIFYIYSIYIVIGAEELGLAIEPRELRENRKKLREFFPSSQKTLYINNI